MDAEVRATDADRDRVVARLCEAVGTGHLELEEFSDRVDLALAAETNGALEVVTRDLPRPQSAGAAAVPEQRRSSAWILGIMGSGDRKGRWRVAERLWVFNLMGGADLDLRSAVISAPVTRITVCSLMGGSTIRVPDGIAVELSGFAIMGSNDLRIAEHAATGESPVVLVRAFSIMGGTSVKSDRRSRRAARALARS
jgi:Domain of unknown function (DUF1707)/Cell wall-active antibiotics response 4TMS YvqF